MKVMPKVAGQTGAVKETALEQPVETKQTEKPAIPSAPGFEAAPQTAKEKLTAAATNAATEAAVQGDFQSPLLEKFGEHLGLALGVIVTEALALSKDWNAPLEGPNGKPVEHVEGADRVGNHALRKRHQEVVGPKIEKLVETMKPGVIHELLEGLARGASAAPGTSYRIEAAVSDWLHGASK